VAKDPLEKAVLAGGCFWGVEELLRKLPGVTTTTVGYTGGHTKNPTYQDICTGSTGHAEAVEVEFDPKQITFDEVLDFFFRLHDPTTLNRQGNDIGTQYRSAIFVMNQNQRDQAQKAIERAQNSGRWKKPITTTIEPFTVFFAAEDYHQNYLQKNPDGYNCHYVRD